MNPGATPIRVYLVDDEEPARRRMHALLAETGAVEVVGEAGDGDAAVAGIREARPDLVFLDIQMPGRSGLEVASMLDPPRPRVIFCTAYDRYALQAFELHALDYLLKPVTRSRLQKAMERVRQEFGERSAIRQEIERAGVAQAGFFPRELPMLATLDYFGLCRPARWVSGDYYDFIPLGGGRIGIIVADVSGKGMAAGLFSAMLQGRLQSRLADFQDDLSGLGYWLNDAFLQNREDGRFITLFAAVYDDRDRVLRYLNAGHLPPLLISSRESGEVDLTRLDRGGPVLGILPAAAYEAGRVRMAPGDLLSIYTDGISEVSDSNGTEFGEESLAAFLARETARPLNQLAEAVLECLQGFSGGCPAEDDQTLVLARGR